MSTLKNIKMKSLLGLFILGILAASCSKKEELYSVQGTVRDCDTNEPIEGLNVNISESTFFYSSSNEIKTDSLGQFIVHLESAKSEVFVYLSSEEGGQLQYASCDGEAVLKNVINNSGTTTIEERFGRVVTVTSSDTTTAIITNNSPAGTTVSPDTTVVVDTIVTTIPPDTIITVDTLRVSPFVGEYRDGGIVFWIDPTDNTKGLVVDLENLEAYFGVKWGCEGTKINGVNSTEIGAGAQNTVDIENGCSEIGTASNLCANSINGGYSDWFLPSIDELFEIYKNKTIIEAAAKAKGGRPFSSYYYWSSSEYNSSNVWLQFFYNGTGDGGFGSPRYKSKSDSYYVRAIRAF